MPYVDVWIDAKDYIDDLSTEDLKKELIKRETEALEPEIIKAIEIELISAFENRRAGSSAGFNRGARQMTPQEKLKRAKEIVAELRELMTEPEVFRKIGQSYFDDSDPCDPYESAIGVIDSYGDDEIVYASAGIYFGKMAMMWVDDESSEHGKILWGEEAQNTHDQKKEKSTD
jgi:hypothetical protein